MSSRVDERMREGGDHPARLFLRFATDRGEKRAMEVIWGNQLRHGEYKYIGAFPHFVRCRCPASGTSRFNRLPLLEWLCRGEEDRGDLRGSG
jgi:hypothetical protein